MKLKGKNSPEPKNINFYPDSVSKNVKKFELRTKGKSKSSNEREK